MPKVVKVGRGSALRGKVKKGTEIVAFSGRKFVDSLDYIYADSFAKGTVTVREKSGELREIAYDKERETDSLMLEFDESAEIIPIQCKNNCIFCFIHQMPRGFRPSLYIRDDDYRLSFISGCYITCTNLSESDIERIIAYKMSPLYVSVHATDETVRAQMLRVKNATPQLTVLKRFIDSGIKIHAQIVLVEGINNGRILEKSLLDLRNAGVETVAVVPVGLTKHRQNLAVLSPLSKGCALNAISIVEKLHTENDGFCFASDEMYQIAGLPVNTHEYYGEYEQIENGVGLIAKFLHETDEAVSLRQTRSKKREIGIFTGKSGENTMLKVKNMLETAFAGLKINIYPVPNTVFGETVTVTGLVTATDILNAYGNKEFTENFLMIPQVMLKEFETVFLDGMTVEVLSKKLHKKIKVCPVSGAELIRSVLE